MQATTVLVDPTDDLSVDPFVLGAASGLLWSSASTTIAGMGEALRLRLSRPGGFAAAQAGLTDLEGRISGRSPIGFAALEFDPAADGDLIVPEVVVGVDGDGGWVTVVGASAMTDSEAIEVARRSAAAVMAMAEERSQQPQPTTYTLRSELAPEVWRDEIVAPVRDRIRGGGLDKVVLARELWVATDAPINPASVMGRLARTFPTANLFSVDGFVGASPELLVARHGEVVSAHPLAGTAPRSADPDGDRALSDALLRSTKDRWEHQITIDWLLDTLLPFCSYVDAEPEPSIITLANVHHLGTRVEGRLSSPAASVLELVGALHPTPAVGGRPQKEALAVIEELERCARGRYAGPTGWVDAEGNGSFAVSVRSAEMALDGDPCLVRLFAGVGVVDDSDPEAELAETRAKFAALLGALVQP